MRIRFNGKVVRAHVDPRYADTSIEHPALVLESGTLVEPSFAAIRNVTLVEATAEERQTLEDAGYQLADDDESGSN